MPFQMFSLVFFLIDANKKSARGNALDDLLHTVSTIPPHLSRDMAVNVQSKRSRGVAQILLHRLDVGTALDRHDSIGVPLRYRISRLSVGESLNGFQKFENLSFVKRLNFLFCHTGRLAGVCWIHSNISIQYCLL